MLFQLKLHEDKLRSELGVGLPYTGEENFGGVTNHVRTRHSNQHNLVDREFVSSKVMPHIVLSPQGSVAAESESQRFRQRKRLR